MTSSRLLMFVNCSGRSMPGGYWFFGAASLDFAISFGLSLIERSTGFCGDFLDSDGFYHHCC